MSQDRLDFESDFEGVLHYLTEVLPNQGPLKIFIHHNTLHAFENYEFYEGVESASRTYNAKAYLSEEEYRQLLVNGRIDAKFILQNFHSEINRANLKHPLADFALLSDGYIEYTDELEWLLKKSYKLFYDDNSHLKKDLNNVHQRKSEIGSYIQWLNRAILAKDLKVVLEKALKSDDYQLDYFARVFCFCLNVSNLLADYNLSISKTATAYQNKIFNINSEDHFLKLCASYIDQDFAKEKIIIKKLDFLDYALEHLSRIGIKLDILILDLIKNRENLTREELFNKLVAYCYNEHQAIFKKNNYNLLLERLALRFPGWAGTFVQHDQFFDYLCVLLLFKKIYGFNLNQRNDSKPSIIRIASRLYYLINQNNIDYHELEKQSELELKALVEILYFLESGSRLRIMHKAYEDTVHASFLDVIKTKKISDLKSNCKYNFVFCIDEREESFRRYAEMQSTEVATYGYAGFFGLDAYLLDDQNNKIAICPPLVTPTKTIKLIKKQGDGETTSRSLRDVMYNLQLNPLASCILSFLAPFYVGWTIFKNGLFRSASQKSLLESNTFDYRKSEHNHSGFSISDMALRVANLLKITGLSMNSGKYIIILGHGAASANNPYKSAYDCGACGGRPGDINAKLFAEMANLPEVKAELKKVVPSFEDSTIFIGGYHNTTTDEISLFQPDGLSKEELGDYDEIGKILNSATLLNAKERSRRFKNLSSINQNEIATEIKRRAYYIAEPRPEYGHATNAMCVVGSRSITYNLFLDRRAFLVSYDKKVDSDGEILAGILRAIVPVCMGINLEYFFSSIDNYTYGAGSKLPQNVVAGIATMTGSLGDLRTGLPKQMIEIHEPIRLAMLIESDRQTLSKIINNNKSLQNPINNGWLRLFMVNMNNQNYPIIEAYRDLDSICLNSPTLSERRASFYPQDFTKNSAHLPFVEIKNNII
jgi:uncharacterized protein YbcC (UPF0753/DUF2309 family)